MTFLRALVVLFAFTASLSWAADALTIKDIRVDGIQRTEAGTVFNYLPVKVGDAVDETKAAECIRALFATGFFSDVKVAFEGEVLIVTVQERPAIFSIDVIGAKDISKDSLKDGLKQVGIAESRIYDQSIVDRAEKELRRQYQGRGRYAAQIKTTVKELERNRVALTFDINEGEAARIQDIHINGAKAFKDKDLVDLLVLSTPGWFTWYTKNDQYSKQKLSADLETLKSYYQNQGYLEFSVDSTQVSITPEREGIFISINITEGQRYFVSDVKLSGTFPVPENELKALISLKKGEIFSRERVTESTKKISDRLANEGYSFATVNADPTIDRDNALAAFSFNVDPGRRVYVRRIVIAGNNRTRDEVVRREIRQLEGAWYSIDKVNRSKTRLERLGFFSEINVDPQQVPGASDQVDLTFTLTEKQTGSIQLGAGYSSAEKIILSTSISQNNVFGTGNALTLALQTGVVSRNISLTYFNPYFTEEGIGRGYSLYERKIDTSSLTGVAPYSSDSFGGNINFVVPLSETDAFGVTFAYEDTKLGVYSTSSSQYLDFVNRFGNETRAIPLTVHYTRDSRDSILYPTKGFLQQYSLEVSAPANSDNFLRYYRADIHGQYLTPLPWFSSVSLALNGQYGYASGYGGQPLPFFKNFFAGGIGSVRGFATNTLGPHDPNNTLIAVGGNRVIIANAELLIPFPGIKSDKSVRLSTFFDSGNVYGSGEEVSGSTLRHSAGVGLTWYSPVGPLKFSYAIPINKQPLDITERLQFTMGSTF